MSGQGWGHTPSIAFRHPPPKKDVVNQCLECGVGVGCAGGRSGKDSATWHGTFHRKTGRPESLVCMSIVWVYIHGGLHLKK